MADHGDDDAGAAAAASKNRAYVLAKLTETRAKLRLDGEEVDRHWELVHKQFAAMKDLLQRNYNHYVDQSAVPWTPTETLAMAVRFLETFDAVVTLANEHKVKAQPDLQRGADDFFTECLNHLAQRPADHPLRPRDAPISVAVRNTALGLENLVETDTASEADLLQASLL